MNKKNKGIKSRPIEKLIKESEGRLKQLKKEIKRRRKK